ncbi:hypothetical protein LEN26_016527 [Aphanomyces euteiches]|nr:hypothetical protein LEN26_016527 [Aphanomyces euteiches]KAH9116317.1 hypothetical protein AeMF1_009742 [Aphanomyces euteiches]KAH9196322.1 hypothetical protein AeNC1_001715 [Aphanomyces euteiches]
MNVAAERRKHETDHATAEMRRKQIADAIMQIPTLFPWTRIDVNNTSLCHEHNSAWNQPLRDALIHEISKIYVRLMKQMNVLNAYSIIHNAANVTRLHGQLLVEVNRKIDVPTILERLKDSPSCPDAGLSFVPMAFAFANDPKPERITHTSPAAMPRASSPNAIFPSTPPAAEKTRLHHRGAVSVSSRTFHTKNAPHKPLSISKEPLFVMLPRPTATLRDLLESIIDDEEPSVTRFRDRPILAEATLDITSPLPKRNGEKRATKPRYLMRENCPALPHQHSIFDDYVVPREVWDAVQAEHGKPMDARHTFEPIELDDIQMSCYYARACPKERDTLSSALHAMAIRREKSVARNITDMVLDPQFAEKDNSLLLREVKTLFMTTNEAYHEFRDTLHKPMKVPELVDMAVKCALNDMSISLDGAIVSPEAMVQIPPHLTPPSLRRKQPSVTNESADRPVMTRREVMENLHDFESDRRLLALWKRYHEMCDRVNHRPFDPIPLDAIWSVRFENVWRGLLVPPTLRLDLALKYSHPDHAHRLADAVTLWEVSAIWIQERELVMDQLKKHFKNGNELRQTVLLDIKDRLISLATVTKKVKESIALTHTEVGDFVTFEEEFYLVRVHNQHRKLHDDLMALPAWREME